MNMPRNPKDEDKAEDLAYGRLTNPEITPEDEIDEGMDEHDPEDDPVSIMDPCTALAFMISRDVIAVEKEFDGVFKKINAYRDTIDTDDVIKNFYEIVDDTPLFKLCEYLKNGSENYSMDEDEFVLEVEKLVDAVNDTFGTKFLLADVMVARG